MKTEYPSLESQCFSWLLLVYLIVCTFVYRACKYSAYVYKNKAKSRTMIFLKLWVWEPRLTADFFFRALCWIYVYFREIIYFLLPRMALDDITKGKYLTNFYLSPVLPSYWWQHIKQRKRLHRDITFFTSKWIYQNAVGIALLKSQISGRGFYNLPWSFSLSYPIYSHLISHLGMVRN